MTQIFLHDYPLKVVFQYVHLFSKPFVVLRLRRSLLKVPEVGWEFSAIAAVDSDHKISESHSSSLVKSYD